MVNMMNGEKYMAAVADEANHKFYAAHKLRKDGMPSGRAHGTRYGKPELSKYARHGGSEIQDFNAPGWIELPDDDSQGEELRRQLAEANEAVRKA